VTLSGDDLLLARIAAGDAPARGACVARFGALVWALARRYTRTPADAEDAVQDIFVDLIRSAARFDPMHGTESGFVAMIARRRLIDLARRRAARREDEKKELVDTSSDSDPVAQAAVPSLPADLEQKLDASRAAHAIASLAPDERDVLLLATVEGLTYAEIAEHKGLPLGTVKTYARRGLAQVRARLASESERVETRRRPEEVRS
jgi:RNA polymerase sigma-70 factor, ECF subfamily